jgi:hypothetical protein
MRSGDIKSSRLLYIKAFLFLSLGLGSAACLIMRQPDWQTIFLVLAAVWGFSRFYFFAFYVLENYIDDDYKFSSLSHFFVYIMRKKKDDEPKE